ncbi:NDP-hexose 3,4-dehydratase [Paramagnetospirillum caucaseum]|uniref:NDP-hexose 3,4-dehydratase n=1 Tax=Paramagnetospirillum caucaseum TaxID=1244869 RepID=M2ZPA1_9PROT|nr:aminotransferase class I/II-fold pyridoxal phosphate-dependent enzyme [Paramagnetospirillum caucaseum]EME69117.1 NDP-hexose 3,4-dehydratase [Paramagnetospirillum caucaseum]
MRVFYGQAIYGKEEIAAVVDVLENQPLALMTGPKVAAFETAIAGLFGKSLGLMVNSGSSANLLALAALDLPKGSEVITPSLTFATTVAPLLQLGLVPVFVDSGIDTYVVDEAKVEAMIGPQTRAMLIPNLIGNLPDWAALRAIADRHGLKVIEDSCDTLGATIGNKPTAALTDISTTSFYASHVVTAAGFGGMITVSDEILARRATLLRGWGRSSSLMGEREDADLRFNCEVDGIPYDSKFVFEGIGYNFLPSEISAAFGLAQLDKLQGYLETRIANFNALMDFFRGYGHWFTLPRQLPNSRTGWLAFPLLVKDGAPFGRRDLQIHFEGADIQTRTVFTGNILRQPGFAGIPHRAPAEGFPNADRVMRGGMLIGCHQGLGEAELAHVFQSFRDFAAKF